MTDVYHVITPGDHYSPRTGSAIPTVVHGLSAGSLAAGDGDRYRPWVVLQDDTFRPRYESARCLEFRGMSPPARWRRYLDVGLGRIGFPRRSTAAYFRPAIERLQSVAPGVVVAHNAPIVPWLLRDTDHRTVLYAHNDILRSYSRGEVARTLGHVSRIVCVSESLASQLSPHLPSGLRERIRIVVNGVDTDQFRPAVAREPGPIRVMFLGRAIPEKGADILLRAAAMIDDQELEYVLVGSHGFDSAAALSAYEVELRELADAVSSVVRFVPFVDRATLPTLLQQADILVLPSRWPDPCPLTVGEGLAAGTPIVAARMGGIPELIGDAGILFNPERPVELARAIEKLTADESFRLAMAQASRERALAHDWRWSWRQLATTLDDIADEKG